MSDVAPLSCPICDQPLGKGLRRYTDKIPAHPSCVRDLLRSVTGQKRLIPPATRTRADGARRTALARALGATDDR